MALLFILDNTSVLGWRKKMFIKFTSDLGPGSIAKFQGKFTSSWEVTIVTSPAGVRVKKEFGSLCEAAEFLLSIGVVFNR
jgi:hypothetical protein